jgi:selenocysteine lyase/cysteine desulfurase
MGGGRPVSNTENEAKVRHTSCRLSKDFVSDDVTPNVHSQNDFCKMGPIRRQDGTRYGSCQRIKSSRQCCYLNNELPRPRLVRALAAVVPMVLSLGSGGDPTGRVQAWVTLPSHLRGKIASFSLQKSPTFSAATTVLRATGVAANETAVATTTTFPESNGKLEFDDDGLAENSRFFPHGYLAEQTRRDFEILQRVLDGNPLIYLDSAASSQKPQSVLQAIQDFYVTANANVHRGAHTLSREATTAYEGARSTVAKFIQAADPEIVFTSGATDALNLLATCYSRQCTWNKTGAWSECLLEKGDVIVLTKAEHHANIVPWQILAQEQDLTIRYIGIDPATGCIDLEEFTSVLKECNERVKIVSFAHVSNVLGNINPVSAMVQTVRAHASSQAVVVLDACQSVPHLPVNVQELGVDYLVASGHKCCGPTGIGFLWGRLDLLNSLPPYKGGGEMIDQVTIEKRYGGASQLLVVLRACAHTLLQHLSASAGSL